MKPKRGVSAVTSLAFLALLSFTGFLFLLQAGHLLPPKGAPSQQVGSFYLSLESFSSSVGGSIQGGTGSLLQFDNQTDDNTEQATIDVEAIVEKRGLSSPHAVALLQQLARRRHDMEYDATNDLLVFEHVQKTGGTTVSVVLDDIGGVMPGSRHSGRFNDTDRKIIRDAELAENNQSISEWWQDKKVMYSESSFVRVSEILEEDADLPAHRQLKMLTMLREPEEFRASQQAMTHCGLNSLNNLISRKHKHLIKTPAAEDPCLGLSMNDLYEFRLENEFVPNCEKLAAQVADGKTKLTRAQRKDFQTCQSYFADGTDPFPFCRSAAGLLAHPEYMEKYHDMYHQRQNSERTDGDYEASALEHLSDSVFWFGLTERMSESMCLLHYVLRAPYPEQIPTKRVIQCRPLSRWTNADRAKVRELEPLDYAVHRAANAILDVRLAKMRRDLQARLEAGETPASMPFLGSDCLEILHL